MILDFTNQSCSINDQNQKHSILTRLMGAGMSMATLSPDASIG